MSIIKLDIRPAEKILKEDWDNFLKSFLNVKYIESSSLEVNRRNIPVVTFALGMTRPQTLGDLETLVSQFIQHLWDYCRIVKHEGEPIFLFGEDTAMRNWNLVVRLEPTIEQPDDETVVIRCRMNKYCHIENNRNEEK